MIVKILWISLSLFTQLFTQSLMNLIILIEIYNYIIKFDINITIIVIIILSQSIYDIVSIVDAHLNIININ